MDNYNYPMGSDTPEAPWNQVDQPDVEIEVLVSVTLSKTVKVRVNDYIVEDDGDEDGRYPNYDFSECDLQKAVEKQIVLPQEAYHYVKTNTKEGSNAYKNLVGWNVDEMECIIDK